jgi:hypothetical protein
MTTQLAVVSDEELSPADRAHGGKVFGCAGVVDLEGACEMLGGASRQTIDRRVLEGLIRKGKDKGRVVYCRQSILDYLRKIEV